MTVPGNYAFPVKTAVKAVVSTADQSVVNSAAVVNFTGTPGPVPNVTMGPSDSWVVAWDLLVTMGSSDGIYLACTVPTGASLQFTALGLGTTGTSTFNSGNKTNVSGTAIAMFNGVAATSCIIHCVATVVGDGVHGGNINLQFAQVTPNGTNTTIQAGAGMLAVRAMP